MPIITPFLWFDSQAEEAIAFYRSVFANSKGGPMQMVGDGPGRRLLSGSWELEGQPFMAINGGPHFQFTEAVFFMVTCADQTEVDDLLGEAFGQAARPRDAAGSRTASACPGRSSQPGCPRCSTIPIGPTPSARWTQ